MNLVELHASKMGEEAAFDQPCKHGHRVGGYAVYCHNTTWHDAPRKCRHTWYWGKDKEDYQDQDCPGFKPNPKGA